MDIVGQAIRHRTFGGGVVTAVSAGVMTVRFPGSEKRFVYPDAFRDYLVLQDGGRQRDMTRRLAELEAEQKRREREAHEAHERRVRRQSYTPAADSHAVFDVAPEDAERVLRTFSVSTGRYQSGYSKGRPRIAARLKPNSACLLTLRPAGGSEEERRVLGAFMAGEDFFGESARDGLVAAHPQYRMALPAGETLLFWDHFGPVAVPRWGGAAFRYCSAASMEHILAEMTRMLAGTDRRDAAQAFCRYFCEVNRLRLPEGSDAPEA